jgi:hypothetical protein
VAGGDFAFVPVLFGAVAREHLPDRADVAVVGRGWFQRFPARMVPEVSRANQAKREARAREGGSRGFQSESSEARWILYALLNHHPEQVLVLFHQRRYCLLRPLSHGSSPLFRN